MFSCLFFCLSITVSILITLSVFLPVNPSHPSTLPNFPPPPPVYPFQLSHFPPLLLSLFRSPSILLFSSRLRAIIPYNFHRNSPFCVVIPFFLAPLSFLTCFRAIPCPESMPVLFYVMSIPYLQIRHNTRDHFNSCQVVSL